MVHNELAVIPFHKSIVDWLVDPREDGSFASGDYAVDPGAGRAKIVAVCLDEANREVDPFSGYALRHLPSELAVRGRWRDLGNLLLEIRFIEMKIASERMYALIADYNLALHPNEGTG